MGHPLQRKGEEVSEGKLGPAGRPSAAPQSASQHGRRFEIDEFGGSQVLASKPRAGSVAVSLVVSQRDRQDARVNDEHGRT